MMHHKNQNEHLFERPGWEIYSEYIFIGVCKTYFLGYCPLELSRNTEDFLGIDIVKLFIQLSWSNIRKFEIGQKHILNALILCKNVVEFEGKKYQSILEREFYRNSI